MKRRALMWAPLCPLSMLVAQPALGKTLADSINTVPGHTGGKVRAEPLSWVTWLARPNSVSFLDNVVLRTPEHATLLMVAGE